MYCASKAGLAGLTRALARDLGPAVRVNGVAPGAILWPEIGDSAEQTRLLNRTPLARPGDPADIAGAVLYLVQAPYVTGQIVAVDCPDTSGTRSRRTTRTGRRGRTRRCRFPYCRR